MNNARAQLGFTLIELVVVMVIIAILATITMNAYGSYRSRAKVQAAKADLAALGLRLENELQRKLVYGTHRHITTAAIESAYTGWTPSQAGSFTYTLNASVSSYTLKAQGNNGSLATCVLTLKETGERGISGCGAVTAW